MLTKKGKYGLKALIALAQLPEGKTAFSSEIAARNRIPKKFLDTILLELRQAGFIRSRKGPAGGYSLLLHPSEVRIGEVIRVIDGPLAPIRCASRTAYEECDDCADPSACLVRRMMTDVRDAVSSILDKMTLEQITQAGLSDDEWPVACWMDVSALRGGQVPSEARSEADDNQRVSSRFFGCGRKECCHDHCFSLEIKDGSCAPDHG